MASDIPITAIRRQIASGVDIMIHLGRLRDKSRKILEITEVVGIEEGEILLNPLYLFREDSKQRGETVEGGLIKIGEMVHRKKMEIAGIREETSQGK